MSFISSYDFCHIFNVVNELRNFKVKCTFLYILYTYSSFFLANSCYYFISPFCSFSKFRGLQSYLYYYLILSHHYYSWNSKRKIHLHSSSTVLIKKEREKKEEKQWEKKKNFKAGVFKVRSRLRIDGWIYWCMSIHSRTHYTLS